MVDVDMSSHTSSLKRTRNRGDSANMSTSLSIASEIPSTGSAMEEDPNGYVMPRASHHPETGDVPFTSSLKGKQILWGCSVKESNVFH